MKLLKPLVLVLCLVFLFITLSSKAQTVDPVTGNLITGAWQGTTPASGYNGYSGGYMPGYIQNQKAIVFGYSQGTASQSIGIANALANAGTGIEVKGYNYSWYYYNNDANRGSLTGNISLTSSTGTILESYNYNMPQTGIGNWIQQSGSQLFANQYQISQVSSLNVSFTGKDDRFWAGYYGPAIKAIDVKLIYGVDPCKTNPAFSPNCTGFDTVVTSNNLVPNPNEYAVFGGSINQSYAINTALASAGSGAQVHGFNWGYIANANGPYCAFYLLVCFDERTPSVTTNVNITNSSGASLYNVTRNYQNSYNNTNYTYLFPSSQQIGSLGNFNFTATTNDQAYIGGVYSRAIYTVDPCVANPMSSPTCKGYYDALAKLTAPATTTTTNTVVDSGTTTGAVIDSSPNTGVTTAPQTTVASSSPSSGSPASDGSTSSQQTTGNPTTNTGAPSTSPVQQAAATQAAPSSTQTKVGEVADAGGSSKPTVSLSSVLNMISANQDKTAALEKSVVQAADAQAFAAGETAKQNAEKVAGEAQSQSIALSTSISGTTTQGGGAASFSSPMQSTAVALQGNLVSNTSLNIKVDQSSSGSVSNTTSYNSSEIQRSGVTATVQESFTPPTQVAVYTPRNTKPIGGEAITAFESTYSLPKVDTSKIEVLAPQLSVYNVKAPQQLSVDNTNTQSSVYTPPKVEQSVTETNAQSSAYVYKPPQQTTNANNTQISTYVPIKVDLLTVETNNTQSSPYVYKPPQSTAQDIIESQGVATTSTTRRAIQEVKQEVTYTAPVSTLPQARYEPPKNEVSPLPSIAQGIQYQPPAIRQEVTVAMVTPQVSYNLVMPSKPAQVQIEMPTLEGIKFGHKGPVDNAMDAKPFVLQSSTGGQQNETVKKNVQNNEAAGNVTIESIAKQPANYAQYFTMIPDTAFYAPKEIYKNQKTIDNARALRSLSSDSLHQRMVDQQYK